jgi:hypothetical protein
MDQAGYGCAYHHRGSVIPGVLLAADRDVELFIGPKVILGYHRLKKALQWV